MTAHSPHPSEPAPPGANDPIEANARAGIQSVEVGFSLLKALGAQDGPAMLRDLAQAAGMSAAKAHRYLVSFARLGLVVQDAATARYDLGPAALAMGLAALSRIDGVKLARERLAQFKLTYGATVAVAVWGNRGATIVHWDESPGTVTANLRLGDVMPLLRSATGRCFAAFLPPAVVAQSLEQALAEQVALGQAPSTARAWQLLKKSIWAEGHSAVQGTLLPGICGVAAPVFDADGHMSLALVTMGSSASGQAHWRHVAVALTALAQALSADLGHRP